MKYWISGLLAIIILGFSAMRVFVVPESMQARVDKDTTWLSPGLHIRWPGQALIWRDNREHLLLADGSSAQPYVKVNTFDQKALQLGYMALWDVIDAELFAKQFTSDTAAIEHLRSLINQALGQCYQSQTLAQWLQANNTAAEQTLASVNTELKGSGLRLRQIQMTALIVPEADRNLWLDGMRSRSQDNLDRLQEQTSTLAAELRAQTDAKVASVVDSAQIKADQWRGEADRQATAIYAAAYHKNPEFYEFYTNLQAYQRVFKTHPPVLLLGDDNPFLKTLTEGVPK